MISRSINETTPLLRAPFSASNQNVRDQRSRVGIRRVLSMILLLAVFSTQRWVLSAAIGYSDSVFYNSRQHTNSGSESGSWTGENTWSAGSAFAAILVLQLSCVFQPAGTLIFDGAIGVWKLSPIYCLLDMGSTYVGGLSMIIRYKLSMVEACAVIVAV
ncbi:putative Fungal pheromone STE3G-protein-coupled receptor [Seiridium cardinale]|uniref:Fungal pheromone STE3G-protein-coupled receptor n=1 Tax=Seiridium cardinale TaxID=138064 RepID=A0ABR2XE36_9PEZI